MGSNSLYSTARLERETDHQQVRAGFLQVFTTADPPPAPSPFAVDPARSRRVLELERTIWSLLDLAQREVSSRALDTLDQDATDKPSADRAASIRRKVQPAQDILDLLPPALLDRLRLAVAQVAALGQQDAQDEILEAAGGRFADLLAAAPGLLAAFADPPGVKQADIENYRAVTDALVRDRVGDHYDTVRDQVIAGLQAGESEHEIAARIQAATGRSRAHSATAARTETTRFYTLGRTNGIEQAGDAVWGYEYVVVVDNRTTPICRRFIGRRVAKADMKFWPPFHFNCRTTVRAVLQERLTGRPVQPDGTVLEDQAVPDDGWGADPREAMPSLQQPPPGTSRVTVPRVQRVPPVTRVPSRVAQRRQAVADAQAIVEAQQQALRVERDQLFQERARLLLELGLGPTPDRVAAIRGRLVAIDLRLIELNRMLTT